MLSPLRNRFGIPGVISVIALVFAMLGGAYAASNNSGGKATASAKAKKGPRGPKGATGPAGPQGPAGPAGPVGAKGDAGANGAAGAAGATGPTGPTGKNGNAGAAGPAGATGPEGSPWTAGGTLPPGETETGAWGIQLFEFPGGAEPAVPISFPIPLPEAAEFAAQRLNEKETKEEAGTAGCTGSVEDPTAPPGALCVYTSEEFGVTPESGFFTIHELLAGYVSSGTVMYLQASKGGFVKANGTWAVTSPEP